VNEGHEPDYLTYGEVVALHVELMRRMGEGYYGVVAEQLLASALARPRWAAEYEDADLFRQAAHLVWGILKNHPFRQGNKRTAVADCLSFLYRNGQRIVTTQDEVIALGYGIEDGSWDIGRVDDWLRRYAVRRSHT
jgi:death on curing protein